MGWTWQALFVVLVIGITVSLLAGQWIAFALGTVGMTVVALSKGAMGLSSIGSIVWNTANSYVLIAIPLFLLMGELILRSGVGRNFYHGMGTLIAWLPGRLLHANIGASALFAAICGSSVATAATIGTVAIPELRARGYNNRLLYGSIAAGGTLGILIPPSIPMILYGALVEESVAKLFMAGIIPGLALACLFSLYILVRSVITPGLAPAAAPGTQTVRAQDALHVLPVAALMVVVLGGIYTGITTPTEAAALGAAGALVLALAYRELTAEALKLAIMSTVRTTSMVMLIVIGAQILSAALTYTGVSRGVSEWIYNLGLSKWEFFAVLVALYVVLGCFVEGIAMIYLTLPVLYPVIAKFGFNPIWFGIVLVVLIEVGQIHPPLGLNLFTIQSIARDADFTEVVLGSLPFVAIIMAMILILCLFPGLALWLPSSL
jgi:tripartite ATP-independent transporter DctM subunit